MFSPRFFTRWFLSVVTVVFVNGILGWGQLPTATLNGIVSDPQGAVVSGAHVTLTSMATAQKRETTTSTAGEYVFPSLTPGNYNLHIEASGFGGQDLKNIALEVGHVRTADVRLAIAQAATAVEVQAVAAGVNTSQSEVQGQIASSTIENMPLNGRNFLELAYLLPGNRPTPTYDPTKSQTLEVSSAGQYGRGGNITVDGGDNNDEVVGGTLMNFPQDGISEFQIATNKYSAEAGRSASSIINIVTKSGTNDLHGSGFIFFRHKALQALPFTFDRTQPTPRFVREQFGGSLGGPIIKDKLFWFASTEYRHQDHAVQVSQRVFSPNSILNTSAPAFVHDFLLTSKVDYKPNQSDSVGFRYSFQREQDIDNGSLRRPSGTAANRQQSLNRYNSLLANWTRVLNPSQVNNLIFHIDYFINSIPAFSPHNAFTNPAGLAAGNEIRFPSLQDGANFRIPQRTRMDRYQLRDTFSWIAGKHTLSFGAEYQNSGTDVLFDLYGSGSIFTTEDFATQDRNSDGLFNDLDIPIAVTLASAAQPRPPTAPKLRNSYIGTFVQDDWRVLPNLTFNLGLRWEADLNALGETSQNRACKSVTDFNLNCEFVRNILGRHDSAKNLHNFGPRVGFVWDPFNKRSTVVRGGYGLYYDRVVLEVPVLEELLNGRILPLAASGASVCSNIPLGDCSKPGALFDVGTPTLANPFAGGAAVFGIGINVVDNRASTPTVQQFTLGVQQEIARNWLVSVDGVHNFGTHFILGRFLRLPPPGVSSPLLVCNNYPDPCTVTDPATGRSDNITNIESGAKTWYDAMLFSLQKRPTGRGDWRWGFNVNYTLSKTLNYSNDDQIPFNGAEDQINLKFHSNDLNLEKGYAPTDERHRFVFYGVFQMPYQMSLSPIWTWSSHVPMDSLVPALNARLPNIRRNALGREISSGAALNAAIDRFNALPPCSDPAHPVPCNPGGLTLNHVDPNLHFGDDFNSFDLRFTKDFRLTERQKLQFLTEAINLFNVTNIRGRNNTNYSGFVNDITNTGAGCTAPCFNHAIQTAGGFFGSGGPRAFQFALRYTF